MKRKAILSIALAGMLAFGAGLGTMAWFSQEFQSTNNEIQAAEFNFTPYRGLNEEMAFAIDEFAPGYDGSYSFSINRNNTTVAVEYDVTLTTNDGLPLNYKLVGNNGTEHWIANGHTVTVPRNLNGQIDSFKLKYSWPFEGNHNEFIGKTEEITLKVVARQIKDDTVQYVHGNVRDKDVAPRVDSYGTFRVVLNDNNEIVHMSGYHPHLGDVLYDGTNFTASNQAAWTNQVFYGGLNKNGVHEFKNSSQNKFMELTVQ